jgi:hypothetical protein
MQLMDGNEWKIDFTEDYIEVSSRITWTVFAEIV